MIQTLDLELPVATGTTGEASKNGVEGKTGAESARNGFSFLALIEKMIAGSMEGALSFKPEGQAITAVGGAEDSLSVQDKIAAQLKKGLKGGSQKKASLKDLTGKSGLSRMTGDPAIAGDLTKLLAQGDSSDELALRVHGKKKGALTASKTEESLKLDNQKDEMLIEDLEMDESMTFFQKTPGQETAVLQDKKELEKKNQKKNESDGDVSVKKMDQSIQLKKQLFAGEEHGSPSTVSARKDSKTRIAVRDERVGESLTSNQSGYGVQDGDLSLSNDGSVDMSIGFRADSSLSTGRSESSYFTKLSTSEGQSSQFTQMLSNEIAANASEFVKAGQIVLRNNDSGLIRLTLHPESLGSVQIRMDLSDHKISGKIIVSSQEAWDAFNENLSELSEAFMASGFDSAGFDLSWSGGGDGSKGQSDSDASKISPFYAASIPVVMSTSESADMLNSSYGRSGRSAINVLA